MTNRDHVFTGTKRESDYAPVTFEAGVISFTVDGPGYRRPRIPLSNIYVFRSGWGPDNLVLFLRTTPSICEIPNSSGPEENLHAKCPCTPLRLLSEVKGIIYI